MYVPLAVPCVWPTSRFLLAVSCVTDTLRLTPGTASSPGSVAGYLVLRCNRTPLYVHSGRQLVRCSKGGDDPGNSRG